MRDDTVDTYQARKIDHQNDRARLYMAYSPGYNLSSGRNSEPTAFMSIELGGHFSATFDALHAKEFFQQALKVLEKEKVRECKKCGRTIDRNTKECH